MRVQNSNKGGQLWIIFKSWKTKISIEYIFEFIAIIL